MVPHHIPAYYHSFGAKMVTYIVLCIPVFYNYCFCLGRSVHTSRHILLNDFRNLPCTFCFFRVTNFVQLETNKIYSVMILI
jgi:hypothetical protein